MTSLNIQLEEEKCIAWTSSFETMALDKLYGAFAVYLCFIYASLKMMYSRQIMKVLCYAFEKDVVVTRI